MNKRIGIITLYGLDNYGNRLQCYAMKRIARKFAKKTNILIENRNIAILNKIQIVMRMFVRGEKRKEYHRMHLFNKFMRIEFKNLFYDKNKYDYYICGSDQVWNPWWGGSEFWFAAFAPSSKRVSYAASFGVSQIPQDKKCDYIRFLNGMKAISVRENSGADIVRSLTGREALVVVDPTMVLSRDEWKRVEKKPKYIKNKNYVLVYFLGEMQDCVKRYINNICTVYNLDLINLEPLNTNRYWYETGPSEFIWLIENCKLVLTDSFHGTVFSVLMDVPFIVFDRVGIADSMKSRIDTLLSTLKLEDRRFNDQSGDDIFKCEYRHVGEILEKEKEKAANFLKRAMELS